MRPVIDFQQPNNQANLPDRKQAAWRYADLTTLKKTAFQAAETVTIDPADYIIPALAATTLLWVNGKLQPHAALPAGIQLQTTTASGRLATDLFTQLNLQTNVDGITINVPAQVQVKQPLHIILVNAGGANAHYNFPRFNLRLNAGAQLDVVLSYHGIDVNAAVLHHTLFDIELAEHAQLNFCKIQNEGLQTQHVSNQVITLAAHAKLNYHLTMHGAALSQDQIQVALTGEEANAEFAGVFLPKQQQQHLLSITMAHQAARTRSNMLVRGIADDRGRGSFNGRIIVANQAQQTVADLSNKNLLLSPQAEINTKPDLEIYTDDVICSHGATVGQLDPDAIFFLRNRGLSIREAQGLLRQAFIASVIERTPIAELNTHLTELIMSGM